MQVIPNLAGGWISRRSRGCFISKLLCRLCGQLNSCLQQTLDGDVNNILNKNKLEILNLASCNAL